MNNKGQVKGVFGFALIVIAFVLVITSFVTIEPLKEALDSARDTTSLNCKGTTNFNQTAYDNDTDVEKLTRRPTCFVTGLSLVYFILAFIISIVVWVTYKWRLMK